MFSNATRHRGSEKALLEMGVPKENIYMDKGLTGTNRDRPGLDQALAAV